MKAGKLCLCWSLATVFAAAPAFSVAGTTERVSVNNAGQQQNGPSDVFASLSGNGRFVVFTSAASNLVANDTNGKLDVFVHDRQTGITERVSRGTDGTEADGFSTSSAISADGRYVAFDSGAGNLVADDFYGNVDVFVHDRQTHVTERVSVDSAGNGHIGYSQTPTISADGRYVAFQSGASDLAPGGSGVNQGVYVHDRQTGATQRVSVDGAGNAIPAVGIIMESSISADARFFVFSGNGPGYAGGDATDESVIYVRDRQSGTTELVSVDGGGVKANGSSMHPVINADGRFVVFVSSATNLVADDVNQAADIFVHDRVTGATTRVSVDSAGNAADYFNVSPSISADGRFVAFDSLATNLVPGDTNEGPDTFVHDRQTGTTERVSIDSADRQANIGPSGIYGGPVAISDDGRLVLFVAGATNLVPGDTNSVSDVFVRDRLAPGETAGNDTTAPLIVPLLSGTLGNADWYVSNVALNWSVTDPESPVVSQTDCGAGAVVTDTVGLLYTCAASSGGGNATNSVTIRRDTTPPSVNIHALFQPNINGWYKANVVVSLGTFDATSGIATCTPRPTFSGEGANQSGSVNCFDKAGFQSSASIAGINIDKTAPTGAIVVPQSQASYAVGTTFNADYTCADGLSGISSCSGTVDTGSPIDTSSVGTKLLRLTVTDLAGNVAQFGSVYNVTDGSTPLFTVSPVTMTFSDQALNVASPARVLTVTNTGLLTVPVTSVTRTGTNANQFSQTNTCGTSIAAGATCTISVVFKPTSAGAKIAALNVNGGGGAGSKSIALSGTGSTATYILSIAPEGLSFGEQSVNVASAPLPVTLTNTGSVALSITSISRTGSNANQFAHTSDCGSSVAVGASCTINVVFRPTSAGAKAADLTIKAGGGAGTKTAALSGTGIVPLYSLDPTSIDFGGQAIGQPTSASIVTLRNIGTLSLPINSISDNGTNANQFSATNTCGTSVPPGGQCTISVVFLATSAGNKVASLNVKTGAQGGTQTVPLTGTGIAGSFTLSQGSITFPDQAVSLTSGTQIVTVTNNGTIPLPITSVSRSGANANQFSQTNTCGTALQPNAVCSITLTFLPTTAGAKTATIGVNAGAGAGSQSVTLTGNGVIPTFSVSPVSHNFGAQLRNTSSSPFSVLVANGPVQLPISNVTLTGTNSGQFSQTSGCISPLAPGASCTISVVFRPTSAGSKAANVNVVGGGGSGTKTVSLSGVGN
jgi:hypothetical protein